MSNKTKWFNINYKPFSVNSMYSYCNGKKVRSDEYNIWRDNFPTDSIPGYYHLMFLHNINLDKPIGIEMQFLCIAQFDVDNLSKSLIDTIWDKIFHLPNDNLIWETKCTRVGVVPSHAQSKIRIRFYNIEEDELLCD